MIDEELESIYVTFLSCGFLQGYLITAGDDGFMYLWEHQRIIRRIFAHEGAIYSLDCNNSLGIAASGAMDGTVILWRIFIEPRTQIATLDKLKHFPLRRDLDSMQAVMAADYNVQSVCIHMNRIIVGMRSGAIYEMKIAEESNTKVQSALMENMDPNDKKTKVRKWLKCADHEVPISVDVDYLC